MSGFASEISLDRFSTKELFIDVLIKAQGKVYCGPEITLYNHNEKSLTRRPRK
jgi:hypothetical protein